MTSHPTRISGSSGRGSAGMRRRNDRLALALHQMDVRFVNSQVPDVQETVHELSPAALVCGLVESDEARLRVAIIPLLLRQPDLAAAVSQAGGQLSGSGLITLRCYYTAAAILQQRHSEQLRRLFGSQPRLPDLFSLALGLPDSPLPDSLLAALAMRHAELCEMPINWLGTYTHAAENYLGMAEAEIPWQV